MCAKWVQTSDGTAVCAQSTDSTFGEKLRQQLKDQACFGFDPRIPSLDFIVHHYAGDVLYSCDKFLDKNRDSLSPGAARPLVTVLQM